MLRPLAECKAAVDSLANKAWKPARMNRNQENDSDACACVCVCAAQSEFEFNKHQKWSLSGGRDKLSESILGGRSQTTASPVNKVNPVKMG